MTHRPSRTVWRKPALLVGALTALLCGAPAHSGERLSGTWGVSQIEGAGGGGLVPWALITGSGSGSRDAVGAIAFATRTRTRTRRGFGLNVVGAAVGLYDSVEVSLAQWRFGLSDTVPGQSLKLNVVGLKWRVFGDAVYDQDKPWPQIAIGAQFKHNPEFAIPAALGAAHARDSDFYVAATKVWLAGLAGHNTLANLTLRSSRANQFGLLGFGGPQSDRRSWRAELSLAVLLRDDLALGGEWRDKPNNLASSREDRAADLFAAWFVNRHLSLTLAWVDLGNVANKPGQRGAYLSVQGAL